VGTDFTDLLPAVDAAASGDTILLVSRPNAAYRTPANRLEYFRKSLRIIGLGAEPVRLIGALQFQGAPREHMIVLSNLSIELNVVTLDQCHGTVVCDRLIPPSWSTLPYSGSLRQALDCGNLVIANCDFRQLRGPAVDIIRGRSVFVQNSRIEDIYSDNITSFPSAALCGTEVQMWITQSQITGGVPRHLSQWDIYYDWGVAVGHPLNGRVANLFVGPGCTISGAPKPGGNFTWNYTTQTERCRHPTNQNSVKTSYVDPSTPYTPGVLAHDPASSFVGCRDVNGSEIVHEFAAVIPGEALRGQSHTLDLWGPTSSILAVYASFLHPGDPISLSIGDVWLDPALIVHVGNAAVDPNRRASLTTTIPAWINPGEVLVYQALALSPQQPFELSPPGFAVVR
jgi:hypothetical protein